MQDVKQGAGTNPTRCSQPRVVQGPPFCRLDGFELYQETPSGALNNILSSGESFVQRATSHTLDYRPFIERQLASRNLF